MTKLIASAFLLLSFTAQAASVRIAVDVGGKTVQGLVYFDHSSNSHDGTDYLHISKLRVRVGKHGYNISPDTNIDEHICSLLNHPYVNYRIQGGGGYLSADGYLVRVNGRNILREISGPSLDMITCASNPFSM